MKAHTRLVSYISFFLILSLCVVMLLSQSLTLIKASQLRETQVLYQDFIAQIKAKGKTAVNIAATLANQENVKEALTKADRETLEKVMLPTWHLLKTEYNVKQFQFHTAKGESFKRMHAPHRYGDSLVKFRHTLVEALQRKTPIVGLEKGVYGVGIRGVVPILGTDNEVLGSVELGFSFDEDFLNTFVSDTNIEVIVYFKDGENYSLYASTLEESELSINNLKPTYNQEILHWESEINNKYYLFFSDIVNDFNGSKMGYVIFRVDRGFYHQSAIKAYLLAGGILAIGLILIVVIFLINRSILRRKKQSEQQKAKLEKSEAQNKNMLNYILEKEKISSLNQVVAGVAHEINTPLGVCVTANSYLIDKITKLDTEFTGDQLTRERLSNFILSSSESAGLINANLSRMGQLINRFKELSTKASSNSKNQLCIAEIISYVVKSFENQIQKIGMKVIVDIDESLEINGNSVDFVNIANHAISNAIQHGTELNQAPVLIISAIQKEGELILAFSDNGQGVDAELLQHLFEPFYTTARNQQCTGLGLNVIYNTVVHNLNGNVEIFSPSQATGGFTVQIKIPLSWISAQSKKSEQSADA